MKTRWKVEGLMVRLDRGARSLDLPGFRRGGMLEGHPPIDTRAFTRVAFPLDLYEYALFPLLSDRL